MHYLKIDDSGVTFKYPGDIDPKKFAKEKAATKINISLKKIETLLGKLPLPALPKLDDMAMLTYLANQTAAFRKIAPMIAAEFKAVDAEIRFICGDRYTGKDKPGLFTRKWMKKASVAAVYCAQEFDPSGFEKPLKSLEEAAEKKVRGALDSEMYPYTSGIVEVAANGHKEIAVAAKALSLWVETSEDAKAKCRHAFGKSVQKAARDMLVAVVAFEKVAKLSVETGKLSKSEATTFLGLRQALQSTGNKDHGKWSDHIEPAEMKQILATVLKAAKVFDSIAKKL